MSRGQWAKRVLGILIAVVLVAGVLYSFRLGGTLRFGDEFGYYDVAHNLVTRHWYSEDGITTTAYRAPAYPFLLSVPLLFGAPIVWLRVLNFVAFGLTLFLASRIVSRQATPRAGVIAAVMLLLYPVLFYTAGTLYPQTVGTTLLLLSIAAALGGGFRPRAQILSGLVFGIAVLCIPSFLPVLPFFVLLPLFAKAPRRRQATGLAVAGALLAIAPWAVRNAVVFHRFIPVSTNSGINLLLGNSENAGPNTGYTVDIRRYSAVGDRMDEVSRDRYYRDAAVRWIEAHPGRTVTLYAEKLGNYFNFRNELDTKGESSRGKDLVMLATYGTLLVLLVVRLALVRRTPPTALEAFLLTVYFASAVLTAVFFTRIRFRLPFDVLLICALSIFLDRFWSGRGGSRPGAAENGLRDASIFRPVSRQ